MKKLINKNNEGYSIVIDSNFNIYRIKERTMQKCFNEIIAPLDIISQVKNANESDILDELGLNYLTYIEQLENGLMKALDELSQNGKDFDYYDKLRELTNFGNYQALDFLDKFSEN